MNTITFTPSEVETLSDAFKTAARFFEHEVLSLTDVYAALLSATRGLVHDSAFTDDERARSIQGLDRQREVVERSRQNIVHAATHLTTLADSLDQRRAAADR